MHEGGDNEHVDEKQLSGVTRDNLIREQAQQREGKDNVIIVMNS